MEYRLSVIYYFLFFAQSDWDAVPRRFVKGLDRFILNPNPEKFLNYDDWVIIPFQRSVEHRVFVMDLYGQDL
jgi:hypothetical protein